MEQKKSCHWCAEKISHTALLCHFCRCWQSSAGIQGCTSCGQPILKHAKCCPYCASFVEDDAEEAQKPFPKVFLQAFSSSVDHLPSVELSKEEQEKDSSTFNKTEQAKPSTEKKKENESKQVQKELVVKEVTEPEQKVDVKESEAKEKVEESLPESEVKAKDIVKDSGLDKSEPKVDVEEKSVKSKLEVDTKEVVDAKREANANKKAAEPKPKLDVEEEHQEPKADVKKEVAEVKPEVDTEEKAVTPASKADAKEELEPVKASLKKEKESLPESVSEADEEAGSSKKEEVKVAASDIEETMLNRPRSLPLGNEEALKEKSTSLDSSLEYSSSVLSEALPPTSISSELPAVSGGLSKAKPSSAVKPEVSAVSSLPKALEESHSASKKKNDTLAPLPPLGAELESSGVGFPSAIDSSVLGLPPLSGDLPVARKEAIIALKDQENMLQKLEAEAASLQAKMTASQKAFQQPAQNTTPSIMPSETPQKLEDEKASESSAFLRNAGLRLAIVKKNRNTLSGSTPSSDLAQAMLIKELPSEVEDFDPVFEEIVQGLETEEFKMMEVMGVVRRKFWSPLRKSSSLGGTLNVQELLAQLELSPMRFAIREIIDQVVFLMVQSYNRELDSCWERVNMSEPEKELYTLSDERQSRIMSDLRNPFREFIERLEQLDLAKDSVLQILDEKYRNHPNVMRSLFAPVIQKQMLAFEEAEGIEAVWNVLLEGMKMGLSGCDDEDSEMINELLHGMEQFIAQFEPTYSAILNRILEIWSERLLPPLQAITQA